LPNAEAAQFIQITGGSVRRQFMEIAGNTNRLLLLHLVPLAVHRFGQVSWKLHLGGIVGKYDQWHAPQRSKRSNPRGIFGLSGGLGSHRRDELWPAEYSAKLRPHLGRN
jgi:hypothetical protein